ncbi:MAG: hypothetical protein ACMXYL_00395 [Candidatus Woesearchaeota archaeon]
MRIRKYMPSDRRQVEFISFETGFLGSSMSSLLSNDILWKKNMEFLRKNNRINYISPINILLEVYGK